MSVPASQRYVSAMQYIETARRLAKGVLAYSCRVPKRYWQRLANPLRPYLSISSESPSSQSTDTP